MQGYFTQKGMALSAKLLAGDTLTVSRVVAGSGQTKATAAALSGPCQTLAVNAPTHSGNTAVIPATLAAASAPGSYTLTELGVYANDPDEGEILYKVYKLSRPVGIVAGSSMVLRFYLEETVFQDLDVAVACSPAGLITEEIFSPVQNKLFSTAAGKRTVSVEASALPEFISRLPRNLTEVLYIAVSGTLTEPLELKGFYGSGSLKIYAGELGDAQLRNTVTVTNCSLRIELENLQISAPETLSAGKNLLYAGWCSALNLTNCALAGQGLGRGVCTENANLMLYKGELSGFEYGVLITLDSVATIYNVSARDNQTGIFVWGGGLVLLSGSTPELLGGSANVKNGGAIIAVNGTLLS